MSVVGGALGALFPGKSSTPVPRLGRGRLLPARPAPRARQPRGPVDGDVVGVDHLAGPFLCLLCFTLPFLFPLLLPFRV